MNPTLKQKPGKPKPGIESLVTDILTRAAKDLSKREPMFGSGRQNRVRACDNAQRFFTDRNSTFRHWCEVLGASPDYIRGKLEREGLL